MQMYIFNFQLLKEEENTFNQANGQFLKGNIYVFQVVFTLFHSN